MPADIPLIIALSFMVDTPEDVTDLLKEIDPPHLTNFAGEARVVVGPHDVEYVVSAMEDESPMVTVLKTLRERTYNGAPDPYQEFYDEGYAPMLERMIERLEARGD